MTTRENIEIRAKDKTRSGFASVTSGLRGIGRQALNAKTALFALAGVGGFGLLLKNSSENIDKIAKLSDRLGIATDALAGIKLQAKLSGVEFETVTNGLRTMQYATYQATLGLQTYTRAFDALNLNANEFARLAPEKQLQTLLGRLAQIPNITERNAVAYQIFGGRASELLNLINDGTEGLERSTEQARAWGLALNRVDSAKVEMMNDSITRLKASSEGLANIINVALAPYVAELAKRFTEASTASNGFRDEVRSGMQIAAEAVGYVANTIQGLRFAWAAVEFWTAKSIDFMLQRMAEFYKAGRELHNFFANSKIGHLLGIEATKSIGVIEKIADVSANRVAELGAELDKIALEGLPHDKIVADLKDINEKFQISAAKIAVARAKLHEGIGQGLRIDKTVDTQFNIDELYRKRLATIEDSFRTENQVINDAYAQQRSIIEGANALHLLDDAKTKQLLEEAELQHQAKLGNIIAQATLARRAFEEQTGRQKLATVLSFGQEELQGVANVNKTIFKIQKAFTLANIALSAPGAIAAAIERGGGLPWGAVFGALTAAKYIALLAQAKGANFSGSTSAASVGGGSATPVTQVGRTPLGAPAGVATAQPTAPTRIINVTLEGRGRYSSDEIRDLLKQINDEISDGVTLTTVI